MSEHLGSKFGGDDDTGQKRGKSSCLHEKFTILVLTALWRLSSSCSKLGRRSNCQENIVLNCNQHEQYFLCGCPEFD